MALTFDLHFTVKFSESTCCYTGIQIVEAMALTFDLLRSEILWICLLLYTDSKSDDLDLWFTLQWNSLNLLVVI